MEKLSSLKEATAWSDNQNVLNKIGEENGSLTYKGKPIGTPLKSKIYTIDVDSAISLDATGSGNIEFYISEPLENALLVDIRFTYKGEEKGVADFLFDTTINGQDILEIFPIVNNEYGMVARIVSNSNNPSELTKQIQEHQMPITAFTLYYLETNV